MLNMLLNYTKLDIQYHNMPLMILIFSTFHTECTAGSFFQIFQYLNHPENRFSIGYISGIGIAIFFQNYIKLRNPSHIAALLLTKYVILYFKI